MENEIMTAESEMKTHVTGM